MKANNNPIRLSGRVFVDKVLAVKLPYYSLERVSELREGDIKLIAVPSQKDHGYQGFIRAWIWQSSGKGGSWRNLAIREKAGTEAIYHGDVLMKEKAREVMNHMAALAGITATKREKQRYYFVRYDSSRVVPTYNPPAQGKPQAVAPAIVKADPPAPAPAVVDKTVTVNAAADGTTVVNVAVTVQVVAKTAETGTPARTACAAASGNGASTKRRRRGKKEDPNQGRLFD
ncbi:MAG: hypothetical protein IT343_14635 [Candidatus Melainabacteria bacterium]|jgi:hypothetical protein|nr:hypothetical protein [Candidatus Melainabacteria bacterium]